MMRFGDCGSAVPTRAPLYLASLNRIKDHLPRASFLRILRMLVFRRARVRALSLLSLAVVSPSG